MDDSRRSFLGATALGLGSLPFVGSAVARTATEAANTIAAATEAVKPSAYGASTADNSLDIISLERLETAVQEVIPEAGYVFVSGAAGDEWTLRENRRGIDVIRALAMGANAVAVGRPVMYGLGLGGAQGVQSVLEHLRGELQSAMLLSGAAKLSDLDPSYINLVGPSAESNRS